MEWSSLVSAEMSLAPAESVDKAMEADLILIGIKAPAKPDEEDEDEDEKKEEQDEPVAELTGMAKSLEDAMGGNGLLSSVIAENNKEFKNGAKAGSTTPVARVMVGGKAKRVVFVGLGPPPKEEDKKPSTTVGVAIGKAIASQCSTLKKVETCSIILPEDITSDEAALQDLSSSFFQELYADNRYKSKMSAKKVAENLKSVQILSEGASVSEDAQAALIKGHQMANGIFLTKDIVNAPHNVLNSLSLGDTARRIAEESGGSITCEILGKEECEKRGMGAYLGVARGSETDPQFIHLTYKPSGDIKKKVALVGKGLLFDTGGYNIKTQMMELMKFDCGGAAAVLGAARAVGALKPEGVEAHFIVAACENMINEKAIVPSDILTAMNGKTIEVLNTDAEGRLTLADALVFADKEVGADSIIELSTLTGACMISLGNKIAGVWTSNDDLATQLDEVSKVTGDKTWRMPLASEYGEELTNGKFSDLKNLGGKYGGAITAALFLQHFVSKKKPFAHIDIAGPVWSDKIGATGFGTQ
eukprot:CAMPEP_0198145964 /NCGR_PEP_ID=MMETSP1443-20131203/26532_1 /TAXON_ID=186043 /ORGANISM="Entomoneis sp., Strain CCMP2396" /LENGTH=530 /DNA_ID=CAMNT_0043809747 /DNA_START=219 /DNA_END=1808 /DNA_ORIENTATION=-